MSDRSAPRPGARSAPAVLASMPWIVVLLGVGLLAVLLVFALLSFRGPERPAAPEPAPPMYLPRMPAVTSSVTSPADAPLVAVDASPTASATATATPSPRASTRRPAATPSTRAPAGSGRVSADYQATSSDRDSFSARLTVRNSTGEAREWRVELLFTGNVKSIRASSDSGLSVRTQGSGWFVLSGTRPLPAGESAVVSMTFNRTGSGDRPGQCTVNGADCTIG
ncbi:cellulose binding domain-containing protein [Micromonospora purpureochromogenes]|uniref:cellulose binding domain-containing protein n=1 Tax=Micromonospora purpureochromogenes TaxID=47872 RepID=UPI0033E43708